jgi:23S rRNA pseudouridine955/2504/2580 synthase/23S rRNA pseudouridine1911/1915/1917 synthase
MHNLKILYEDEILLVCNKPSGLMVEPDRNNFPNLLQDVKKYLKSSSLQNQPYVQHLHRIDRPTSGIVLFTKNKEYLKNLSEQFAQRTVSKYYLALTKNAPKSNVGIIENWHRKEKNKAILFMEEVEFTEKVSLDYIVDSHKNNFLWKIKMHTGKFHQIRAQLASINCPILGDALYNSGDLYKPNAIALHAAKLIIQHPLTHKEIIFEATQDDYE